MVMKYTTEIIIALPPRKFIEIFDNPAHMKHWQKGLTHYKVISGNPGHEGSKMELQYKMGKREMVLIETIIKRNLPYEFHATYDTRDVHNIQKNFSKQIDPETTQWISATEFGFSGFMMKAMSFRMPGAFKKQSKKYAEDFKTFAENGVSVAEN
jgi:hypothetical protein